VKLDDEGGAAGLAFHAHGGDRHYGFYPSAGQLRLTRFDGPDVYSWHVLEQKPHAAYRPGEWNTLRVRVEKGRLRCYVNGQLAIESTDAGLTGGKVGLAKFRDTRPEFKNFQVGRDLSAGRVAGDVAARITRSVADLPLDGPPAPDLVKQLQADGPTGLQALRERARQLDKQAARLRELAVTVHQRTVQAELAKLLQAKDEDVDLVHAALLLARLDNDELDVAAYRREVERLGGELARSVPKDADEAARRTALNKFLFAERGYHGSRGDYYNRSNSYLNEVLDDREGIPITLSVLYMTLARRIGLNVVGVGLPGHFVVKHVPAKGQPQLIDVFEGGVPLSRAEASKRVEAATGLPLEDDQLAAVSKRAIVVRMLQNLLGIARGSRDLRGMLTYLDTLLAIAPDSAAERWVRAMVHYQLGHRLEALEDVNWLLDKRPDGIELDRVEELRRLLTRSR
jgi:serine protease Do